MSGAPGAIILTVPTPISGGGIGGFGVGNPGATIPINAPPYTDVLTVQPSKLRAGDRPQPNDQMMIATFNWGEMNPNVFAYQINPIRSPQEFGHILSLYVNTTQMLRGLDFYALDTGSRLSVAPQTIGSYPFFSLGGNILVSAQNAVVPFDPGENSPIVFTNHPLYPFTASEQGGQFNPSFFTVATATASGSVELASSTAPFLLNELTITTGGITAGAGACVIEVSVFPTAGINTALAPFEINLSAGQVIPPGVLVSLKNLGLTIQGPVFGIVAVSGTAPTHGVINFGMSALSFATT